LFQTGIWHVEAEGQLNANDARERQAAGQTQADGVTWREAAERLERLRTQGEPWTSQQEMAKRLGCSSGTINKAIKQTPSLKAWAKRPPAAPRAQSLHQSTRDGQNLSMVTDNTPQERELDPQDEAAIREFLETADPQTKAWFHALSTEDQLAFLDDPDKGQKVWPRP
jgi:hypothetical protein